MIERIIGNTDALSSLRPNSEWSMTNAPMIVWEEKFDNNGNSLGEQPVNLEWYDPINSIPTREQIDAETLRLQNEYDAKEYQRLRQPEYPPLSDLADALYWQAQGDDSKMATYLAAVDAVKQKYPKE